MLQSEVQLSIHICGVLFGDPGHGLLLEQRSQKILFGLRHCSGCVTGCCAGVRAWRPCCPRPRLRVPRTSQAICGISSDSSGRTWDSLLSSRKLDHPFSNGTYEVQVLFHLKNETCVSPNSSIASQQQESASHSRHPVAFGET